MYKILLKYVIWLKKGIIKLSLIVIELRFMVLTVDQMQQKASVALKEGNYKRAEYFFRFILKTLPAHPDIHFNLGNTLQKLGRLAEAVESYKKAIDAKPNNSNIYNNACVALQQLGRLEESVERSKKAIALKPDSEINHFNLGISLLRLGRLEEAEASYKKAIELKPAFASAHKNLGTALNELGKLEEAEASYKNAIEINPSYKEALMSKGQLLLKKKDFELALKDFDLCNTETSRYWSLVTLYALNRIDEIYKRIKINSELDEKNLSVASFSSFITEKEKKHTAHNFCNNPMDFIYFSNISSHCEKPNSFITEVIEELQNIEVVWEPYSKATKKGFQSSSLLENPLGKIKNLKSIIINEIDSYYSKFKDETCAFIKKWPSEKNIRGWHVILKKQGYQIPHIHPSGWLSGVIYLKVVPPLEKSEGAIEFSLSNGKYLPDVNSPKIIHEPKIGEIILFPSSLHHRTIPFTTDTDRIIISFDLKPSTK